MKIISFLYFNGGERFKKSLPKNYSILGKFLDKTCPRHGLIEIGKEFIYHSLFHIWLNFYIIEIHIKIITPLELLCVYHNKKSTR